MWNRDSRVVSLGQLLCTNSATGRRCAQSSCRSFTQKRRYCSNHWLERSDCPSVQGWYAVEMFCWIPRTLHSSLVNFDANRGSLSLMILEGSPKRVKTCLAYKMAVSSPDISSTQGMNTVALEQSWSVIVSIESYPCDMGSFVMKSSATVSKGIASGFANMGWREARVGHVLTLLR